MIARMQHDGWVETVIQSELPEHQLILSPIAYEDLMIPNHSTIQGTKIPSFMPWIFFLSAGTMVARQPPKEVSPWVLVKK